MLFRSKEDLSYITDEEFKKCAKNHYNGLFKLIEIIHFNKDNPQNHNVYITNKRTNEIFIYDGEKFNKTSDKEDKIEDIINNSAYQIHNFVDNNKDLDTKIITEHDKFRNNFYKYNKEVLKNNNDRVNDMLYNNRDLIIETHKK